VDLHLIAEEWEVGWVADTAEADSYAPIAQNVMIDPNHSHEITIAL
jgi:hypothetical protein